MPASHLKIAKAKRPLFTVFFMLLLLQSTWTQPNNRNRPVTSERADLLEKFKLHKLRDFVLRGRGRGSVSRLSFAGDPHDILEPELVSSDEKEEEDASSIETEEEMTELGTPPPNLFQIVMPSNRQEQLPSLRSKNSTVKEANGTYNGAIVNVKTDAGSNEPEETAKTFTDYERLANILQNLLNHQKAENKKEEVEEDDDEEKPTASLVSSTGFPLDLPTTTIGRSAKGSVIKTVPVSVEIGKSSVVEQDPAELEDAVFTFSAGNQQKLVKDNEVKPAALERVSWSGTVQKVLHETQDDGAKGINPVKANSALIRPQILGKLLIQPSRLQQVELSGSHKSIVEKNEDGGTEEKENLLPSGKATSKKAYVSVLREGFARQSGQEYVFVASITLVRDQGKVLLIDTGLGTDINGRTDLIEKLGRLNIAPPAVDFVVTTHGHADHSGNTNEFPDAVHYQGAMVYHRNKFNFSELFEGERQSLTENVALIRTPGHTPEDIGVVISNTDRYGTVVVAGDTFLAAEDMDSPMMWRPLAWNETIQEESRRRILCMAEYIVPGHGRVFRVTKAMRTKAFCRKNTI